MIRNAYEWHDLQINGKVRAHSLRAVSTSVNFTYNRSLYQVLKAGSWAQHNTFTRHYLKRISVRKLERFNLELGPIVAALGVVGTSESSLGDKGKK